MITDVQEVNSRPFAPLCGLGMKLEIRPPTLQLLCVYVHTSIASPPLHHNYDCRFDHTNLLSSESSTSTRSSSAEERITLSANLPPQSGPLNLFQSSICTPEWLFPLGIIYVGSRVTDSSLKMFSHTFNPSNRIFISVEKLALHRTVQLKCSL